MATYIDVEKLIEKCHPIIDVSTSIGNIGVTLEEIRTIAPATEVAEVVRCEDCKYFSPCYHTPFYSYAQEKRGDGFCSCEYLQLEPTIKDSFFCAYGERREDNG